MRTQRQNIINQPQITPMVAIANHIGEREGDSIPSPKS